MILQIEEILLSVKLNKSPNFVEDRCRVKKFLAALTVKYMLWKSLTCWIHSRVALGIITQVPSLLWAVSNLICAVLLPVAETPSGFAVFLQLYHFLYSSSLSH